MTDARFPDRWLNDRRVRSLSDREFRGYVVSLTWSASNQTDGRIRTADARLIPDLHAGTPAKLVAAELWTVTGDGWQVCDWTDHQTTAAEHEARAAQTATERERKRLTRLNKRVPAGVPLDRPADRPAEPPADSSLDGPAERAPDSARPGQDRPGQDRPGALTAEQLSEAPKCSTCGEASAVSLIGGKCRNCHFPAMRAG